MGVLTESQVFIKFSKAIKRAIKEAKTPRKVSAKLCFVIYLISNCNLLFKPAKSRQSKAKCKFFPLEIHSLTFALLPSTATACRSK